MESEQARIVEASFVTSIYNYERVAEYSLPECAIVGRSNVGKSSLLNALANRRKLADTSKTPGRTQAINVFNFRVRFSATENEVAGDRSFHMMDLPGYGFAATSKKVKKQWNELLGRYLMESPQLRAIILLNDSRRIPSEEEQWFLNIRQDCPVILVITKCDKLSKRELLEQRKKIAEHYEVFPEQLLITSAGRERVGINQLTERVCASLW